ncbi:MAG TPA: hypothetical protein VG944_08495 [Fimbriimonas sp.]|nr:hypothetical protein [Fimbriimonas sp.]
MKFHRKNPRVTLTSLAGGTAFALALAGCGGSGTTNVFHSTKPHTFRYFYVYTANAGSNDISAFRGNADGSLTFIGKTGCAGSPTKIIGDTKHLYALIGTRIQVFSGVETGQLAPVQTYSNPGTGGTSPTDISFCVDGSGTASVLCAMCTNFADSNKGDLVALNVASNGSLSYGASLIGFNKPTAINSAGFGGYLAVANSGNDTVSELKITPSSVTLLGQVKVGSASTADFGGIQSDALGHFYVTDRSAKSLTEVGGLNVFRSLKVVGAIDLRTTPLYFGATSNPSNRLGYDPVLLTVDKEPNIATYYSPDDGFYQLTFKKGSGTRPELGSNPTAINGMLTLDLNNNYAAYVYSTTSSGSVRFYTGNPDGGKWVANYDSQGSGLSDILVTGEIGAIPPVTINPKSLPDAKVKASYSQDLAIAGGDIEAGQKITITSGDTPPGLDLVIHDHASGKDATIEGVPKTAGTYSFTVQVQRGQYTGTQKYTLTVTGGSGPTTPAVFVNDTTNSQDSSLSATVAGVTLQAGQGEASTSTGIATGAQTLTVKRSGGQTLATKSISSDQQHHYVLVTVGNPSDGYDVIQDQFDIGVKPPANNAWFTFYPGIKGLTETVDFYLLLPGATTGTTTFKLSHVAPLSTTSTMTVPVPGNLTVTILATEPDQPSNVIATKTVSLTAGGSYLGTLVSREGTAATFDVNQDTLK